MYPIFLLECSKADKQDCRIHFAEDATTIDFTDVDNTWNWYSHHGSFRGMIANNRCGLYNYESTPQTQMFAFTSTTYLENCFYLLLWNDYWVYQRYIDIQGATQASNPFVVDQNYDPAVTRTIDLQTNIVGYITGVHYYNFSNNLLVQDFEKFLVLNCSNGKFELSEIKNYQLNGVFDLSPEPNTRKHKKWSLWFYGNYIVRFNNFALRPGPQNRVYKELKWADLGFCSVRFMFDEGSEMVTSYNIHGDRTLKTRKSWNYPVAIYCLRGTNTQLVINTHYCNMDVTEVGLYQTIGTCDFPRCQECWFFDDECS